MLRLLDPVEDAEPPGTFVPGVAGRGHSLAAQLPEEKGHAADLTQDDVFPVDSGALNGVFLPAPVDLQRQELSDLPLKQPFRFRRRPFGEARLMTIPHDLRSVRFRKDALCGPPPKKG